MEVSFANRARKWGLVDKIGYLADAAREAKKTGRPRGR